METVIVEGRSISAIRSWESRPQWKQTVFPVIWETTAFSLMMMLSFPASNNHLNKNTLHKPIMIKAAMMMTLITRVLVKIFGLFCIFLGGTGGGTSCLVPQIGHMRTPSRSSVPHLGQIISSTPVLLLCIL